MILRPPRLISVKSAPKVFRHPSPAALCAPASPLGEGSEDFPPAWGEGAWRTRAGEGSLSSFGVSPSDMADCVKFFP